MADALRRARIGVNSLGRRILSCDGHLEELQRACVISTQTDASKRDLQAQRVRRSCGSDEGGLRFQLGDGRPTLERSATGFLAMPSRQLHLGAFMRPASIHTGAWRYPGAWPDMNFNFAHIKQSIQALERAKFDAFFMADHMALLNMPIDALKGSHTSP